MSSFKVAELVLALGNLGLWRVLCFQQFPVFPAVSARSGIVLSAVSVSAIRNLVWCPAVKQLSLFWL